MDIYQTILAGIIIATASSWITVRLSLSRYRSEKWWEKKAEVYSGLIGAIHDAKAFAEEHIEAGSKGKEISSQEDESLRLRSKNAESEIYRALDVGAFYLSEKAIARLQVYITDYDAASNTTDWYFYLTSELEASKSCLADMIEIARDDLNVGRSEIFLRLKAPLNALTVKFCTMINLATTKLARKKSEIVEIYRHLKKEDKKKN